MKEKYDKYWGLWHTNSKDNEKGQQQEQDKDKTRSKGKGKEKEKDKEKENINLLILWLYSLIQGTSYLCTQRLLLKRSSVRKKVNWFGQQSILV